METPKCFNFYLKCLWVDIGREGMFGWFCLAPCGAVAIRWWWTLMHSCEIRILHMAGTGGCIKSTTITHLHGDFFVDEFCISRNHHFPMNIAVLAYSIVFPMFRHSQVSRVAWRRTIVWWGSQGLQLHPQVPIDTHCISIQCGGPRVMWMLVYKPHGYYSYRYHKPYSYWSHKPT